MESRLEIREAERLTRSESFADVLGARVRYRLLGSEKPGPTAVFVNGMAGSIEQWHRVQPLAAAFSPVLLYDRAGHGFSTGSSAHDAGGEADELAGLLSALGIRRPVVLVAYSTGASIARVFVQRYRERVAGIVLVDAYLPEIESRVPGRDGPLRAYFRGLLHESFTTLFGFKRIASHLRDRPPGTGHEQMVRAILMRFPHWWAVDREVFASRTTEREVSSADRLARLPMIVLQTPAGPDETGRVLHQLYRELAARSERGSTCDIGPVDHSGVLDDEKSALAIVEAIRGLIEQD